MRTFDLSPFYRSTVGFDRLFDMLDSSVRPDWPPYDIEKLGEDQYRISMAVAGFSPDEIELTQEGTDLLVIGRKDAPQDEQAAAAPWHRRPELQAGLQPRRPRQGGGCASWRTACLSIDLVREVPEQLKPRRIEINGSSAGPAANDPKQIENNRQAEAA